MLAGSWQQGPGIAWPVTVSAPIPTSNNVRSELLTVMYSEYQVSFLFYATLSHMTKILRTMSKSQDSRFTCLCNVEMWGVTGEVSRTNKQGVARTGLAGGGDAKPLSGTFSLCVMTEPESFSMCYSTHTQRGRRPSSSVRRYPKGKQGVTVSIWVFFPKYRSVGSLAKDVWLM